MIQKHRRFWNWLCVALSFVVVLATPIATFAWEPSNIPEGTLDFFNLNGIYNYNPGRTDICSSYVGSAYNGETSGSLIQPQVEWVVRWHDLVEELSVTYGIPWETAMAQSIIESSNNGVPGQSHIAQDKNNFHGINAVDGDAYNKAFVYSDAANGWVGYFDNIARTSVYRNKGAFNTNGSYGNAVTDPYAYLQAIAAAGYASSQSYIAANSVVIDKIIKLAEEQGWATSSQLAADHPEMLTNASIIGSSNQLPYNRSGSGTFGSPFSFNYIGLSGDGSGGSGSSGGILSNSICGPGRGNGNLNDTAIKLAWPNLWDSRGGPSKPHYCTPTPAFIEAAKEVGTWDDYTKGCSCDRFVSTVIRYSGVDPNVPRGATGDQLNYFLGHPEIYKEIPNTGNTADLLPGDILVKNGHIMMYVQLPNGTEAIAEASISYSHTGYEGRAGEIVPINWESRNGYHVFRYIGGR